MRKVRIFDLKFDQNFIEKFKAGSENILKKGFLTNDQYVENLQDEFSRINDSNFCLAVSSGTAAIEMALKTIDVRGKKVVLPTNTFIADYLAVLNAGGVPVLIDVEGDYFSLSLGELNSVLKENEIGAVITVHIGGHISPDILKISSLCKEKEIPLIEDCSHAHGAVYQGIKAGNFGDFGCFSLFTTKVVTGGEGGLLITKNKNNYTKAKSIRQFGMDPENLISHIHLGGNFKLSEFPALLSLLDLERFQMRLEKRRALASRYQKNLKDSGWRVLKDPIDGLSSYYKQIIIPPVERIEVEQSFFKKNISITGGVYYIPLHQQPILKDVWKNCSFPIADNFCKDHFCPPCYPELSLEDIDYICEVMLSIHK